MADKYNCRECANAATPICRLCRYIQRPGGEITKPTMFVRALPAELIEDMTEEEKQEAGITDADDLAIRILACIECEVGIPLRYVMLYNTLVEDEEEEQLLPPPVAVPLPQEGGKDKEEGGNGQTEEG